MKMALIATLLLSLNSYANFQKEIVLLKEGVVSSQEVCLQDLIAEGWVKTRCELENKKCCLWNLGGQFSRLLSKSEIQQKINKNLAFGFDLVLKGAPDIPVSQKYRLASLEELAQELNEKVKKLPEMKDSDGVWVVDGVRAYRPIYVNRQGGDWFVEMTTPVKSRMTFQVHSGEMGNKALLGQGEFNLKLMKDVYHSNRNIKSGEQLNKNDFHLKKTDILPLLSGVRKPIHSFRDIPQILKTSIAANSILYQDQLQIEPQVKIGDLISLVLKSNDLRITTKATSQSNALVGDSIKVQLLKSTKTFQGKLLDEKMVEVSL